MPCISSKIIFSPFFASRALIIEREIANASRYHLFLWLLREEFQVGLASFSLGDKAGREQIRVHRTAGI